MATEFKLPDLGENIESGDVVSVLVKEGDQVQAEQAVIEIETDKATVEIPCPHAGRVAKVLVSEGDTIKIGDPLLSIEAGEGNGKAEKQPQAEKKPAKQQTEEPQDKTEAAPAKKAPPQRAQPEEVGDEAEEEEEVPTTRPATPKTDKQRAHVARETQQAEAEGIPAAAGPSMRRLARELGVDLQQVDGTGPGGRITRDDIVAAVRQSTSKTAQKSPKNKDAKDKGKPRQAAEGEASQDNWGATRIQKMSRAQRTIAANMARTVEVPRLTNMDDADITELERIRKGSMADYVGSEVKLTMMAFVLKAVAQSLRLHPNLNASLDLDNESIIYKDYVNLGVAVDTDRGLIVPVLRNVDRLSIPQIASQLADLAETVRGGKFDVEQLRGGSFSVSNLGSVGGVYSTPIINPPEVAILLVGRSRKLPVVMPDDRIEPRLMMPLSLSYDHRLVDGATAARFLNEVKNYLQVPGRLLLAT